MPFGRQARVRFQYTPMVAVASPRNYPIRNDRIVVFYRRSECLMNAVLYLLIYIFFFSRKVPNDTLTYFHFINLAIQCLKI